MADSFAHHEMWEHHADQLVYINPKLADGKAPILNPLDIAGKAFTNDQVDTYAQQVLETLSIMLSRKGGDLTINMELILLSCIRVLLYRSREETVTLWDIVSLLEP